MKKGYLKGEPDLELKCEDGDRADIRTIELKNPNGSNNLSIHQEEYIELLHDMNVKTLTNSNYSEIIDFTDLHINR